MQFLTPLFVLLPVFGGVVLFVKVLTDYWLKKKLIEKGMVDENSRMLFATNNKESSTYSNLKWGLLALFGGIGLSIINFIPYHGSSPLPYGVFLISIAAGFLVYYVIVKREIKS